MPQGSYSFEVGDLRCTVFSDGYFAYPTGWFFPNAERDALGHLLEQRGQPRETVLSPYTCLLIETGRHVVLVDTGAGPYGRTTGAITARLEQAGIRPAGVDTVILTHAHPDHAGGATDPAGRPAFPKARYVMSEFEWEFWTAARTDLRALRVPEDVRAEIVSGARRTLGPLRFQVEPVWRETEIIPGVRVIPAPGHTPGHLAVLVSSKGLHLLNLGDAAVHPLHLERLDWENGFDLASAQAIATRHELMDRAAAEEMRVMAFHFPFPSVGKVAPREQGGWDWTPGW